MAIIVPQQASLVNGQFLAATALVHPMRSSASYGTNAAMAPERKVKHRKKAAARREHVLKVLVTDEESKLLQEAADHAGASVSSWIRQVAIHTARQGRVASGEGPRERR